MPATLTVERYCKLLARSRLLTEEQVKTLYRSWMERNKVDDDAEPFRKSLVVQKLLTEYQSMLLMRGHHDGFFLDQYKILDLIAKGRMAGVYKAQHTFGQIVAVKVLPPTKAKDPVTLGRFQRESKLLTKLDHPNVVRALQAGEVAGKYYLAMEYLEGETLEEVLARRKRLPIPEAVRIIHQAMLGLQNVYENSMVHRDLKPSNLMLVPTGPEQGDTTYHCTVKLLDIGLGRTVFDENAKEPDDASLLTGAGVLIGTPDYLSPEQARSGRDADIRSDIYSLGCILFHAITGQPPFPDTNILSQIAKHATEPMPPLSNFVANVPPGLDATIGWMTAKDPTQRYPVPEQAAEALKLFLAAPPEPPRPQPTPPATTSGGSAARPALNPDIPVGKLETPSSRSSEKPRRKEQPPPSRNAPAKASEDDYDVELVADPTPTKKKATAPTERRGLFELDRRDLMMAGAGGGLVLAAILMGWGLSRALRSKPPATEEQPDDKDKEKPKEKEKEKEKEKDPPTDQ